VIAVDTNILVYAHREDSPFHSKAYARVETLAESKSMWAIPWPCLHEFFAISTNPRIYPNASTWAQACAQIESWIASPTLVLLNESPIHWQTLRQLLSIGQIKGAQVHDARIAALCIQHGVSELWSADRDFSRFSALRTRNPLTA
jgi:uncharacterized protein